MKVRGTLPQLAPNPHLVAHDLRFCRSPSLAGSGAIEVTVECERRACTLPLSVCRACPRFARIDVHEAGYVMLCRSTDEALDD